MKYKILSYGGTDIGPKRKNNQDSLLRNDSERLYIVADGMGGHRGGEVASHLAVETIENFCKENPNLLPREALEKSIIYANKKIFQESQKDPNFQGMGTTVAALLFRFGKAVLANVGDSRVYLFREGLLWQITEDHSLVHEEVRAGRIQEKDIPRYEFKNIITRSVGYEDHVEVDTFSRLITKGDVYVMCSDGLSNALAKDEIRKILSTYSFEKAVEKLIEEANASQGYDNVTVLICQVAEEG